MVFNKSNYLSIEVIKGGTEVKNINDTIDIELNFQIARVYDWFDETLYLSGNGTIKNNYLTFNLTNILEKGLYILICIEDKNGNSILGRPGDTENCIGGFTVLGKDHENALNLYRKIYQSREDHYNRPKGRVGIKNTEYFDVCIFCQNIYVGTIAQYDSVMVYPYDYLWFTSEVDYINRFFKNNINITYEVHEEPFKTSRPSAVFIVKNIAAYDYDDASQIAMQKVELLNNIFTMLLRCHGTFFCAIAFNSKKQMTRINMLDSRYKGNLFLFAENGFNIRQYYECLSAKDTYLQVYIKLLNEAKNEGNRMMQYYRYWNILESLADKQNYCDDIMMKWDNTAVFHKGIEIKIGKESLNTVFELLRRNFSNGVDSDFIGELEYLKSTKDFLSVCYQRRNCCAHQGSCFCNDPTICLKTKDVMLKCKENNIVHPNESEGFKDKILRKLEDITFQVIAKAISNYCGDIKKDTSFVNKLINQTTTV